MGNEKFKTSKSVSNVGFVNGVFYMNEFIDKLVKTGEEGEQHEFSSYYEVHEKKGNKVNPVSLAIQTLEEAEELARKVASISKSEVFVVHSWRTVKIEKIVKD